MADEKPVVADDKNTPDAPVDEGKHAASSNLVVTAPLVGVKTVRGDVVQLYRGARLDGIEEDEIARLIDLEMVGEDTDVIPGVAVNPNSK